MLEPTQIIEESDSQLSILWSDETETTYHAAPLRRKCPCATCVNEWTGKKMLDDRNISDDLTIRSTAIVGRYALSFTFSDDHETGIYSFKYLRELSDAADVVK